MFSNAKVPPPAGPSSAAAASGTPKNSGLKKCFQILVDRKQLCLDKDVLKLLMLKELGINMSNLEPQLIDALPYLLTIYMKNWPGWQKSVDYYSGKMQFREWYLRFRQYIILKMNFIIKNGYKDAVASMENDRDAGKYVDKGSQTDNLSSKELAPYKIAVKCPPEIANNLVFCSIDNDIILRCHSEIGWNEISTQELVNWSFIEIRFISQEFVFTRKIQHKYLRCISLVNTALFNNVNSKKFIESVGTIDPDFPRQTIPLNILNSYYTQYMDILKKYPEHEKITQEYFEEISLIVKAFLLDVEELKINDSMATNTTVVFNIGGSTYTRNKKITKSTSTGHTNDVGYIEYITPRVEISLKSFKPQVDSNGNFTYLKYLSEHPGQNRSSSVPRIIYNCIYCNLMGMDKKQVMDHLKSKHKMEQSVLCVVCKRSFQVYQLARNRWNHNCPAKTKKPTS